MAALLLLQTDVLPICSNILQVLLATTNRHAFIGRTRALAQHERTAGLPKASLVVCHGRRRIGKSTLTEHFAQGFEHFYEFQALAPHEQIGHRHQLDNFGRQLSEQFSLPAMQPQSWYEAFTLLAP